MDWKEINLQARHIEVTAGKSKTASRRLVPIPANLLAWLSRFAKAEGKVWPRGHSYFYESQSATAEEAGVTWKHNALRHSWISYRVALVKNVNQVALEAGNSPRMICWASGRASRRPQAWERDINTLLAQL